MWQNVSFEKGSEILFEYKYDDEILCIRCRLNQADFDGAMVYACYGSEKFLLGTLKKDEFALRFEKSYPMSFLRSHGIKPEALTHFEIQSHSGDVLTSFPLKPTDPAIERAEKILESMSSSPSPEDAEAHINLVHKSVQALSKEKLPFASEFIWHKVDDIKQTFSLSAIEHIVFTPAFMQSFIKSGCWFLGTGNAKNVFAMCIATDSSLPNPMQNALDCCQSFKAENALYCVIGIGLYDDGQYFCRL
ncbi:MAG: hypothetical protein IKA95_00560 [Clostridia bacterium]|nr:hypothetical protein [Clostridia bacterium]